jgi:hypothetical protein
MPQYDIRFAEKLADTARLVIAAENETREAAQTVLYLSLLSCEIALKAILEKAGMPVPAIRRRSHGLAELLKDIGSCEVKVEVAPGMFRFCSGNRLRAITVDSAYSNATIGNVLEAEYAGASKFPNGIRYGEVLYHYHPLLVLNTASLLVGWGKEVWDNIRVSASLFSFEIRKNLLKLGCSKPFAEKSLIYASRFDGDYESFISHVEEVLCVPRTASASDLDSSRVIIQTQTYSLNDGNMRVEFDYNGDYLTSFGLR